MRAKGLWDCGVIVPLDYYTTISSSRRRKKLNDPSVTVKNYDFYGVGPSDIDADGIPDDVDDELSVDRFDIRQRVQSELNTMLNEGDRKTRNYMFFSNLKQMRRQIDIILENFNPHWVDSLLCDGHDGQTIR